MIPRALVASLLVIAACSTPAPQAPPTALSPVPRAPTATPRPEPPAALALVVLQVDEATIPPAEPTPMGLGAGRPTATPYATPESGWKYVTFSLAVENRSDAARLVGIGGSDSQHTNLADAVLTARDGQRYKAYRSVTSFGLRTATARSLSSYPVLLRLPPGFRAAAESFGAVSTAPPPRTSITFRVPASLAEFAAVTVPPLAVAPRADDEVARRIRAQVGALQRLDLSGVRIGTANSAVATPPPVNAVPVGGAVSVAGRATVTLAGAELSDPADFQARNRGWKQLSVALRYRNDDPAAPHAFAVSAWLFGDDGVVYSGDVPALGDFGRATSVPEPSIIGAWDGRTAGPDQIGAGQEQETRRATFQVPAGLSGGLLVLAGEIEAIFRLSLSS